MARASRAEAESHRREVLDAAAAQVREVGADAVTVPRVMAAAGLTHGGFYRHFRSKQDLVAHACTAACAEKVAEMERIRADSPDGPAARRTFIAGYLSVAHRDAPGQGCGIAALAGDVARAEPGNPLRSAYLDGLYAMIDKMVSYGERSNAATLVELSVMVGALALARASAGDEVSEHILDAARDFLLAER